jgi:hypothetical protein
VLLDREGNVLASAWQGNRYLGLEAVMRRWLELSRVGVPGNADQATATQDFPR